MNYKSQTLTAVVITNNHADTIEATLDSVRWADEVIVLDRGSTDGTLEIAQRFTRNIQYHPAEDKARLMNDAFSLAKCDWILYLEPGEWVEEMLRHEIDGLLLNSDPAMAAYSIPRKLYFDQTCVQAGGRYPDRQIRMFRRGQGRALTLPQNNEIIAIDAGEIVKLDRAIAIRPYRTLSDLFAGINERSTVAAYARLEQHGTPTGWDCHPWRPLMAFKWTALKTFWLQGGFRDGFLGITFALASSLEQYLTFAKLRMLSQSR